MFDETVSFVEIGALAETMLQSGRSWVRNLRWRNFEKYFVFITSELLLLRLDDIAVFK